MAIVSYITVIGLLIAFLVNNGKNNAFTAFHIGQSFRVFLAGLANFALAVLLPNSLDYITSVVSLGLLALIIVGIINAANGKADPLPLIGRLG